MKKAPSLLAAPPAREVALRLEARVFGTALETTQGQMDDFLRQLPYKCHLEEVASVED